MPDFPLYVEPTSPVEEWKVIHYDHTDAAIAEFQPENLTFNLYLNKVGGIQYDIDMGNERVHKDYIYPYRTDYKLYKGALALQGGIHTSVNIEDLESNTLSITGNDWMHYLERVEYPFNPADLTSGTYIAPVNTDIFDIVEYLLNTILGQSNTLSFTYNIGLSGQTVNQFKIERGDTGKLLEKISSLAQIKPGFDIEVTPARVINLYAPQRGTLKPMVFETGKNLQALSYTNNGPAGTSTLGTGTGLSGKLGSRIDSAAVATYRRLNASHDYPDVRDATQLALMVQAESDRDVAPQTEFSFKYIPEAGINIWKEIAPGDSALIHAELFYDEINEPMRVVGMEGKVENGEEEVTITVDDGTLSL